MYKKEGGGIYRRTKNQKGGHVPAVPPPPLNPPLSQGFPAGFPAHNIYDRLYTRHRVGALVSPQCTATMFMTGPANSTVRAGRPQCLWQAQILACTHRCVGACMLVVRPARAGRSGRFRTGYIMGCVILQQGMRLKVFSKVYCDRIYICAPSCLWHGPMLTLQRHPLPIWVPPPPRGGGGGDIDRSMFLR